MHAEVIGSQLVRIKNDLTGRGLTYENLRADILDHICCMVEEAMDEGKDFDSSYTEVMSSIDENRFAGIQHETLLLLDKKFQKMKRITYVLGFTGSILAIIGALFKMMHWPGASIILTLGFLIVVAAFLPLYFIQSYREQTEKPMVIFPVIGYFTLLIVFTGAIFKIMHWPGANILIMASFIIILVGFLPMYIVQVFKKSSGSKVNPAYIVMLLVGLSIVIVFLRVNISKYAIDRYTELSIMYEESSDVLDAKNTSLIEMFGDSISEECLKVSEYAEELMQMTDEMLNGLLAKIDQSGVPIDEITRKDYRNAGRDAFVDNGLAEKFKEQTREYRDHLLKTVHNQIAKNEIEQELMYASKKFIIGWDPEDYLYDPVVTIYSKISSFKKAIAYTEYLALSDSLHE